MPDDLMVFLPSLETIHKPENVQIISLYVCLCFYVFSEAYQKN